MVPACQAIGTQFGARQRRRTPMIHRGRAAQQIRSAGRWEEIEQVAGRDLGNAGKNPGSRAAGWAAMAAVSILASPAARNVACSFM